MRYAIILREDTDGDSYLGASVVVSTPRAATAIAIAETILGWVEVVDRFHNTVLYKRG
jgi:hypothetical protein